MATCTITFKGQNYTEANFNAAVATDPIMRNEVARYNRAELYQRLINKEGKNKIDALNQVISDTGYSGSSIALQNDIDILLASGNPVYGPISNYTSPRKLSILGNVWNYVRNIDKNLFGGLRSVKDQAGRLIGNVVFEAIRKSKKSVEAETRLAVINTRKLNSATNGLNTNDKLLIAGILRGDKTVNDLSITDATKKNEIRQITSRIRAHIDQMTQAFIDLGMVNPPSLDIYIDNKGKYVTRMYQSKLDPEGWWSKMTTEGGKQTAEKLAARAALSRGVEIYKKQLQERIIKLTNKLAKTTSKKKRDIIQNTINSINGHLATDTSLLNFIKDQISSKNPIDVKGKGSPLKADFGIFKKRSDIPQEIRDLMGEIDTPVEMYQGTIKRMAHYLAKYELGKNMANGQGVLFDLNLNEKKGFTLAIPIDNYPGLADNLPIGTKEIYILPEIETVFKGTLGKREGLFGKFEEYNSYLKWAATVGNPVTQVRNFYSIFKFLLGNGNLVMAGMNPGSIVNFYESLGDVISSIPGVNKEPSSFGQFLADQYLRSGAISSSIELAQFENMTEARNKFKDSYEKVLSGKFNTEDAIRSAVEFLNKAYQGSDNLSKMFSVSVEAEMRAMADHGKTLKQLYEEAQKTGDYTDIINCIDNGARVTKRTIPNYEETWALVEKARKVPFIGVFIAFPMEQVRNKINLTSLIIDELKSPNKTVRAAGSARLISSLSSMTITYYGAQIGTSILANLIIREDEKDELTEPSEKQREIFQKFYAAPWEKGVSVVFSKNGDFQIINTGTIDPDAMFKHILDGTNYSTSKAWTDNIKATLEPVLGSVFATDLATNLLSSLIIGKDGFGRDITNDPNAAVRALEKVWFAARESLPGGLKSAFDIYWKDVNKVTKLEDQKEVLIQEINDTIKTNTVEKKEKLLEEIYKLDKKIGLTHRNRQAKGKSILQGVKVRHGNVQLQATYRGYEYKNNRDGWRKAYKGDTPGAQGRVVKEYEKFVKDLKDQYWMTLDHLSIDLERSFKDGQIPVKILDYITGKTDKLPPIIFE